MGYNKSPAGSGTKLAGRGFAISLEGFSLRKVDSVLDSETAKYFVMN